MQNNLATDIIEKLKKRIKILMVAVIMLSLLCAGLSVAYVREATMCGDCKEKVIKQRSELFMQKKEDGEAIMQKRRAKDGKAHNV